MSGQILYNSIMSHWDRTEEMLQEGELVKVSTLIDVPEAQLNAEIIYVKKGTRISMFKIGDKSKKVARTYDRLIFFRDLESGLPFVVVSESRQDSIVLFHKGVVVGDYVRLHMPDYSHHLVADIQVINYCDVLMPLVNPPHNVMVPRVVLGPKFGIFAVQLDPQELDFPALGIAKVCSGTLCDGTISSPCPCLAGTGVEKFSVTFKIRVKIRGLEDKYAHFRSLKFTRKFFGPTVMRKLNLYSIPQLRRVILAGMENVEGAILSGWVGYAMDSEDDLGTATTTHLSSLHLISRMNENGEPLLRSNDDLALPANN